MNIPQRVAEEGRDKAMTLEEAAARAIELYEQRRCEGCWSATTCELYADNFCCRYWQAKRVDNNG